MSENLTHALLVTNNLMFSSRVVSVASDCGIEMSIVPDGTTLLQQAAEQAVGLVLLDLGTPGLDVSSLVADVRQLAQCQATIVAFGPHVDQAGLTAARQAGCDEVLPRSKFNADMVAILSKYK